MQQDEMAGSGMKQVATGARGIKRGLLIAGSTGLMLAFGSQGGLAMSLEEAIKLSVDAHPVVLVEKSKNVQADYEIDEAKARYLPSLDTTLESGYDDFNNNTTRFRRTRGIDGQSSVRTWHNSARVDVTQMLFDGFETPNLVDAARWRSEVTRQEIRDAEEEIALRATEAYLEVMRAREIVDLAMENVQAHIDTLEDVRLRAETGGGNQADVLQAESRLALAMMF